MKKSKENNRLISLGIGIALIAVVVLGGLLIAPDMARQISRVFATLRNRPHTYTFDAVTIKGPLARTDAELVNNFLSESLKVEVLPKTLWFQLAPKPSDTQGADAYIANWNQDGKPVSILLGKTQDGKKPAYLRIWTMPPGDSVTQEEANTLIDSLFAGAFQQEVGELVCSEINEMTECASIKTLDDGSLRGLTVRAPFLLTPPSDFPAGAIPPEEVIIVSSCLIPQDGAPYYRASSCL